MYSSIHEILLLCTNTSLSHLEIHKCSLYLHNMQAHYLMLKLANSFMVFIISRVQVTTMVKQCITPERSPSCSLLICKMCIKSHSTLFCIVENCKTIDGGDKQEQHQMLKYPQLPRSAYVHRAETVKYLGPWNGLGILVHAEDGAHEAVRPVKQSKYSWLSGGYVVVMYFR